MKVGEISQNQPVTSISESLRQKNTDENSVQSQVKDQKERLRNISKKEVEEGVNLLNKAVQTFRKELKFKIHDKSDRMMVEVINLENNEIIKEIPPKEILDMIGRIREMVGILLDENV
ncbi:MAG: flagellar protein FlaG [Halanaerobiales bacterium]|nr:flagellar protein FlaG [Halanaerobiales bacterium]